MSGTLVASVRELKLQITAGDGRNVADASFRREVDRLISAVYDDIGAVLTVPLESVFELFVIKVLYVERRSSDASVVDYLGGMLSRYLYARELFPLVDASGRPQTLYFADVLEEMQSGPARFQNLFEAFRRYADNALFLSGMFPQCWRRGRRADARPSGRRGRMGGSPSADRGYFVSTGKTCYRLAADHELAEFTRQRPTLLKLSGYFEVYLDALNELSERYVTGFDFNLLADKMLDRFNLYRRTGDERHREEARRYAALLRLDSRRFPALYRKARPHLL